MNLLLVAYNQPEALKLLLEFIDKKPTCFDQKTIQKMFLKTDGNGWNSLMFSARYQPEALKLLLKFIDKKLACFDQKTIQEMFLNLLLLTSYNQPAALKLLLKFIDKKPICFDQKTIQKMFLKKDDNGWNSLMFSARYRPALKLIQEFIIHSNLQLDKKFLTELLQNTMDWNFSLVLLEKYLAELSMRKRQYVTPITKFFRRNFGYSTQEKENAALALKSALKGPGSIDLLSLKEQYPAFEKGKLGLLIAFFALKSKEILDSRENSSMSSSILR